jgi:AcrR family transcriptional regulator
MTIDKLNQSSQARPDGGRAAGSRAYDSPRRREQAQATRAAIAVAARRLFLARGWAGTRVRDVAREAGVAEPTVYAVYGSKAGLAHALVDAVDLAAGVARSEHGILAAGEDPAAQLAAMVAADRRLFERGGDVIALLRDAGRSEPALQAAYAGGRDRADQIRRAVFATWPARWFRPGADAGLAADTFAALCNIGVYQILTDERGWAPSRIEKWWRDSLQRLLLR